MHTHHRPHTIMHHTDHSPHTIPHTQKRHTCYIHCTVSTSHITATCLTYTQPRVPVHLTPLTELTTNSRLPKSRDLFCVATCASPAAISHLPQLLRTTFSLWSLQRKCRTSSETSIPDRLCIMFQCMSQILHRVRLCQKSLIVTEVPV